MMRLVSIQTGQPAEHGRADAQKPMEREWTTAFFKEPVEGPLWLGLTNLAGDGQADLENHGGPDKAVLAYAASHYPLWRAELGVELPYGGFGENFTVEGQDESTVCLADVYEVGGAVVEVSQPRMPCWKIARRWGMKRLTALVERTGRTGWYLRVLREGEVRAGDEIRLVERPLPEWSVARASRAYTSRPRDWDALAELVELPRLAESLRAGLRWYLAHRPPESADDARLVGPNAG